MHWLAHPFDDQRQLGGNGQHQTYIHGIHAQ